MMIGPGQMNIVERLLHEEKRGRTSKNRKGGRKSFSS